MNTKIGLPTIGRNWYQEEFQQIVGKPDYMENTDAVYQKHKHNF